MSNILLSGGFRGALAVGKSEQSEPKKGGAGLELFQSSGVKRQKTVRSGDMESETAVRLEEQPNIVGDWQGTIGEKKNRLVIRIAAADDGGRKATFHPIDQTAQPIPIDPVVQEGRTLKLTIPAIQGGFEGTISADANSIVGTLTQGQSPRPLELQRATTESSWLAAPVSYQMQLIEVEDGVKLEVVDWGGSGRPVVLWLASEPTRTLTTSLLSVLPLSIVFSVSRGAALEPPVLLPLATRPTGSATTCWQFLPH
jgi:hypothetical protein